MQSRFRQIFLTATLLIIGMTEGVNSASSSEASAVIFVYHRFGEDNLPSTSISLARFEDHIAEFTNGRYNVIPLPDIIEAFKADDILPDHTIGISIDDAYLSVYNEAWPRLRAAGLPFTIFVATDPIDRNFTGHMTWDHLREMSANGVTIGHHTTSHLHMPLNEMEVNERAIEEANKRFESELGYRPKLFAYPYGEFNQEIVGLIRGKGFAAAFGQHSGVTHEAHDLYTLPRFALSDQFGELARLRLAANALPLPVSDVTPANSEITTNPPLLGFTVKSEIDQLDTLACYASHESNAAHMERLGNSRIEVRMHKPFPPGRGRVNCTMNAGDGRWRWFGIQFLVLDGLESH